MTAFLRSLLVATAVAAALASASAQDDPAADMLAIPGGTFTMGDPKGEPNEAPRQVTVNPFRIMRFEVTNRQFARFVAETGHRTDPERRGYGFVWSGSWRRVADADWRHPTGPGPGIENLADHPVVHVSARDAAAFCAWAGLRLPTEEEWEFAARGTDGRLYPWGNQMPLQQRPYRANFGTLLCCVPSIEDGYSGTAPVGTHFYGRSPYGAMDMAGNVWEWTASRFPGRPDDVVLRGGGWGNNPWCLRVSYRHGNPDDIGLDMVGFRCAGD